MSDNFKAGIRFNPDVYAEIGYDSQNETGEMSVIGANGETIWESGEGGGSSGFTTVKMKLEGVQGIIQYSFPILTENEGVTYTAGTFQELETNNEVDIILPIGGGGAVGAIRNVGDFDITYSGNIQNIVEDRFIVTGDCTITLAEQPT